MSGSHPRGAECDISWSYSPNILYETMNAMRSVQNEPVQFVAHTFFCIPATFKESVNKLIN